MVAARARTAGAATPRSRVTAVVLAAGTSSRFGRSKPLASIGGVRLIDRTLSSVAEAGVDRTVVVVGHRGAEVRAAIRSRQVTVVENPEFTRGMSGSLRRGVRAASDSDLALIVLADQPFVAADTIRTLVDRARAGDGSIFIPTYDGVRGNPVLFDLRLAPELERVDGDVGCRAMFPRHPEEIREVPVDDPGILVDVDTEDELGRLAAALKGGEPLRHLLDRVSEPRRRLHTTSGAVPRTRRLRRAPDIDAIAAEMRRQGQPFALATVVRVVRPTSGRPGYKAVVRADGSHTGWVGGACTEHLLVSECLATIAAQSPRLLRVAPGVEPGGSESPEGVVERNMVCQSGGTVEIFIEPNVAKPELLIVGDSPVAVSLATLGGVLGFRVVLVAPGADPTELPEVDEVVGGLEALSAHLSPTTYAVVASMGKYDESALAPIARAPVAFAGLVASRTRARSVFDALREDGISEAQIGRIRNPAGIDIAASTPEEIALSVLAEITRVRRTAVPPLPAEGGPAPAAPAPGAAVDPVCGMTVETSTPLRAEHLGTTYYFCAEGCRRKFVRAPKRYLARAPRSG